ncbi:MAG: M50 family metallopeptidase [Atopobiaceae bacterium]|jgi:regulator of sigma E protease
MGIGGVFSAIFWGLMLLSLLVFVHEGGHYLAARICGVRVTEFFLGMPSTHRLSHKSKRWGTEIGVTPIFLGGYTRICGMAGMPDELLDKAFQEVQARGRISAYELADALGIDEERALNMLITLTDWAAIQPFYDPELGELPGQKDYPARFETLQRDKNFLTEYDRAHDFSQEGTTAAGVSRPLTCTSAEALEREQAHTYLGCGFWKRFFMLVAGPLVNIVLALALITGGFMVAGQEIIVNSNTVASVTEGSLAADAGVEAGDTIVRIGSVEVTDWRTLTQAVQSELSATATVELDYERDGQLITTTITIPAEGAQYLGVNAQTTIYRPGLFEAGSWALNYAGMVGSYVVQLLVPTHTMEILNSSTSIVGISVMASEAASQGVMSVVEMLAMISMSLGFMNLLPIPPLDGGKILIEIIQACIRRPLSLRAQSIVSYVGIAFFIFVFVVVLRNDFVRFLMG